VPTRTTASLAPAARLVDDPRVLIFLLLGFAPWLLLLTLALALYLTVIELRELQPHYAWWIWWLLLVFMTHFIGYLFLRAYAVYRRWDDARSG
jgi:hypothetical protein